MALRNDSVMLFLPLWCIQCENHEIVWKFSGFRFGFC